MNRENVEALIQEQIISNIEQELPKNSVVMSLGRKLANMTSKQTRIPVLDLLPMAYFVDGDTGFKRTTVQAWDKVYITAEEMAAIVPIPEAVLEDSSYDIMGEVQPRIFEAMGALADGAVFFGANKPLGWGADLITRARQAGNNVTGGAVTYDTLLGEDGVFGKVETAGYGVNGGVADLTLKAKLRGIKDDVKNPIFKTDMQGSTPYSLDGAPLTFAENGSFDKTKALLIVGDWSKLVWAIRQDVTVKVLTESVIQDPVSKEIIYNLSQQDMIALRVVMRLGWALPNPATRLNADRINCPFAYLEPATAETTKAVTFTVTDGDSADVEGARIDVEGAKLKTDSSGEAVFNLRAGTYNYKATKSGYVTASGTFTVAGSAVSVAVTLNAVS